MLGKQVTIVYDEECPFCSNYVSMVRLKEAVGGVNLLNARDGGPIVDDLIERGYDLDQGMVLLMEGEVYYGADAINRIALLSTPSSFFNRLNGLVFKSRTVSRALYPFMKTGRAITLAAMGRKKIADGRASAAE
ncbi:MAG: DCC1-like thiol-disulfide oxidoreductase family protein [Pseudomonadota bacterium]